MPQTIKRNCPNCGNEFECDQFHLSKIYCSDDCKRELNREHNRDLNRKSKKRRKDLTGTY